MTERWIPGLIPASRRGWWRLVSEATAAEIEHEIASEYERAREEGEFAALHWKRWLGLHFAWVKAMGREARA